MLILYEMQSGNRHLIFQEYTFGHICEAEVGGLIPRRGLLPLQGCPKGGTRVVPLRATL
jgi:hypothetical protein